MLNVQYKGLFDNYALRITTEGILTAKYWPIVGASKTAFAVLLFALMARMTMPATIDHTAHTCKITRLKIPHFLPHGDHATDNFVAWHGRVDGVFPLVAGRMQVRMTNAAIKNFNLYIFGSGGAAINFKGR